MPEKKQKKSGSGGAPQRSRKKKGGYLWTVLGIAFLVLLSGIVYLSWERPSPKKKEVVHRREEPKPKEPAKNEGPEKKEEPKKHLASLIPAKPPIKGKRPRIAIIIDDLGNSKGVDNDVLAIGAPLTVSIFPLHHDSKEIAEKAYSKGMEVMLHLPMEPHDYPKSNPGEGALLTNMDDIAIITQLYEDLKSVPNIKGVNNHMGSRFTEDDARMRIVLKQLKDKGLFFIDSKTSHRSSSEKIARDMGMKAAARDVFLDNEQTEVDIEVQIKKLEETARRHGSAIGIGHPYPATIAELKKILPRLQEEFELVPASQLVR